MDWVAGGVTYELDGTTSRARVNYGFPFDGAVTDISNKFCVIYQTLGTKALLLRDGDIVRELNRSFYCAESYQYPVCFLTHAGRTLLVHCPVDYNRIEIEDAATGECLTERNGKPDDFFHSRFQPSPNGVRVLSAGWIWHPRDVVEYFDVAEALESPDTLNTLKACSPTSAHVGLAEEVSATWLRDDLVVLTGGHEEEPDESGESSEAPRLRARGIASYDVASGAIRSSCVLSEPAGTVMRVDDSHVLSFYGYPKLVRLRDGVVVCSWPHISSGKQTSSIISEDQIRLRSRSTQQVVGSPLLRVKLLVLSSQSSRRKTSVPLSLNGTQTRFGHAMLAVGGQS